jgi:type IV pilus assembly protein PilY1
MNTRRKHTLRRLVSMVVALSMVSPHAGAALIVFANTPLYLTSALPPKVMLDISKDQQLYKKAYNDYTDLDGDGALETTYKHAITYYGYFDPFKCYAYSTANNRFEPQSVTTDKLCSGQWSGNFLNWGTMTRMDALRKLLYGGMRSTDSATDTVLERAYLPTDAHAFAKYYVPASAADPAISQLTPFAPPATTTSTTSTTNRTLQTGSHTFTVTSFSGLAAQPGDQIRAQVNGTTGRGMVGWVTGTSAGGNQVTIHVNEAQSVSGSGTSSDWTLTNLSVAGISLCNMTPGSSSGSNRYSHTNTNAPLIRVASGNYMLWGANERWQCKWSDENANLQQGFNGSIAASSNGNKPALSGLAASAENPSRSGRGLGTGSAQGEYNARVRACVATLLGTERCKEYTDSAGTSSVYKPTGLLQTYGEPGLIHFGLMTGSYAKNKSGGELRKNPGVFTDEIDPTTGIFRSPPSAGHIVGTLNRMRMYGYDYNDGTYIGADGNCTYQLTDLAEGQCTTWGNPMSEIYFESIRYFAGRSATSAYNASGGADATLGLPSATWADPLNNTNYCTPLSVVAVNASVSSYDEDLGSVAASAIGGSGTVATLTNAVGTMEGVNGTAAFAGRIAGTTASGSSDYEMCTGKTMDQLGNAVGICPEGPSVNGSYHIAGLAYQAKTNRIRSDLTVPASDRKSLKVDTYGVQLSTNVPTITIPVPGQPGKTVVLQPAYRLDRSSNGTGPYGGGSLVDVRVVAFDAAAGTGTLYVNWEDSEQGGDYDQDMWGVIRWSFPTGTQIRIETDAVAASTAEGQGFGYIVSGTTQDGAHFHSGIYDYDYTDPDAVTVRDGTGAIVNGTTFASGGAINASGGCRNCKVGDPPTSVVYTIGSGTAAPLKDPLYYAAKYGGFADTDGNAQPNLVAEWDAFRVDGSQGSDGLPDNYFLVSNPLGLESALNRVFQRILQTSSASSVATNSTSLQTGSRVYQAQFNSNDWSGRLVAFPVDSTGVVSTTPAWDAGALMNPLNNAAFSPASRVVLTTNRGIASGAPRGVAFRWPANPASPTASELAPAQVTALSTHATSGTVSAAEGVKRLNFLRGDATNEGPQTTDYRRRDTSKLGDIINSNPTYVGPPSSGYLDPSYGTFRLDNRARTPVIYVGANDGMLHGFNAGTGAEVLAYVPSPVYGNLPRLTEKGYGSDHRYFVDGTAEIQDVCLNPGTTAPFNCAASTNWASMLVGTLGAGGQGVFALDVTSPSAFSESNASSIAKWEFTGADDDDLGNTTSQPLVRRMANGRFAAIVSGGYNNGTSDGTVGNRQANLFILFVNGPTGTNGAWQPNVDYVKLTVANPSGFTDNGFGQPFAADVNSDGVIDFIYVGDLRGRLFKFDVRSVTPTDWAGAANVAQIYTAVDGAGNPQPITGGLEASAHPQGGILVNFGTGKYLETNDLNPPGPAYTTQTVYGVWDRYDFLNAARPPINVTTNQPVYSGRSKLVQQSVIATTTLSGETYRVLDPSVAAPTYLPVGNPTHAGWYLDLPLSGERSVFPLQLINSRLIYSTLVPSTAPCDAGGTSYLMAMNNLTGGAFNESIFDTSGDGRFNATDRVTFGSTSTTAYVSGRASKSGITPAPTIVRVGQQGRPDAGGTGVNILSDSSANIQTVRINLGRQGQGRLSWREVLND